MNQYGIKYLPTMKQCKQSISANQPDVPLIPASPQVTSMICGNYTLPLMGMIYHIYLSTVGLLVSATWSTETLPSPHPRDVDIRIFLQLLESSKHALDTWLLNCSCPMLQLLVYVQAIQSNKTTYDLEWRVQATKIIYRYNVIITIRQTFANQQYGNVVVNIRNVAFKMAHSGN